MLSAIAKDHAGVHTLHYVRKVGAEKHEVLLVPEKSGNLSTTAAAANTLSNYLQVELKVARVWVEYSGTSPPPSALAKTGTAIGWIILIALMAGIVLFAYTKASGRPLSMPNLRSASAHLPTPVWRQEDLSALRRRAEAPFSGFARFKNMGEGDGVVEIKGLETGEVEMGTDMMILKPDDLMTDEANMARSFSNPMFNVEPPSNIYSAEPTQDMTYGVDNPTYVAFNETKVDKKDEKESHYEVIGTVEDEKVNKTSENAVQVNPLMNASEELEISQKALPDIVFEDKIEDIIGNTQSSNVEEICVTNDLLDVAETIITEEEKKEADNYNIENLS